MWVSDRHPDRERILRESSRPSATEGPRDDTEPVAAFARPGARYGKRDGELRVGIGQYEGRRYLSLRLWERDPASNQYFPVPGKGCTVRLREVVQLRDALDAIIEAEGLGPGGGASDVRGAALPPARGHGLVENFPQVAPGPSSPDPSREAPWEGDRRSARERASARREAGPANLPATPGPSAGTFNEFND